ncbi:MAG: TolC family protein [Elusimicrobia bacterium]|nr:TolC family protein [Elusimicrobiota bacterium]
MSLTQAQAMLVEGNDRIRAARAAVEAAEAEYRGAFSVNLPKLSANLSHARTSTEQSSVLTLKENSTLGLTGSLPIFAGGANQASLRKKKFELEKSRAQSQIIESQALYDLREAYARTLFAQEAIHLSSDVVRRREENVLLIRQKYEAGRESKAALLEVESMLSVSIWEREKDGHALRLAQRRLNKILARPMADKVRAEPISPLPKPESGLLNFETSLAGHPILRSNEYAVSAGRESLAGARSGFLPMMDLESSLSKVGSTKWGLQDNNWQWALGIKFPFFSGGRTVADIRSATAEIRKLDAEKSNAKGDLWIEAEDSFFSWEETAAWLDVAEAALKASESRAWLVGNQYATGQAAYFEWRNVEDQLVNVQKQLLAARRDLIIAHARFEKAMGRGVR